MLTVQRMTPDSLDAFRMLDGAILAGEDVMLRITRSGFALGYVPLPRAEWRTFLPDPRLQPEAVVGRSDASLYAAFEDGLLIGTAAVCATPQLWADVMDIRVAAQSRRQGVARMLLDACSDWSQRQGMQGLRMIVPDSNPVACQFCEHCGFTLQGVDRMALIHTPDEKVKPLARRACALIFYQQHQKG